MENTIERFDNVRSTEVTSGKIEISRIDNGFVVRKVNINNKVTNVYEYGSNTARVSIDDFFDTVKNLFDESYEMTIMEVVVRKWKN